MSFANHILKQYPNAKPGDEVREMYLSKLEQEHGGQRDSTLLATSLCADDINVTSTGFQEAMHGPFVLGGLGGLPFAGRTGMTAYAHHIPDAGTAFIFYGPHIGVTKDGQWGRMLRPGQSQEGFSCGALMLALQRMQTESPSDPYLPQSADDDFQQTMLERSVIPFKPQILAAEVPQIAITEATYNVIHKQIQQLVEQTRAEFHGSRIFLLGGIIINTDPNEKDWVDVRHVEVIELA